MELNDLKKVRISKGYSQGAIAKKMGLTTSMISKYEKGQFVPPIDNLIKLSNILELDPIEMFKMYLPFTDSNYIIESDDKPIESEYMGEIVKYLYANGCDICGSGIEIENKVGKMTYLETTKINDNEGMTVANTAILCPNCHKRLMVCKQPEVLEKLQQIALKRTLTKTKEVALLADYIPNSSFVRDSDNLNLFSDEIRNWDL